ncbi:MAG: alkaline phosphatase family protein [Gemmatimonadaceae bacterium]|nr:alkaline phosphatase family protein [Gemmatimonadaceae bacterium]
MRFRTLAPLAGLLLPAMANAQVPTAAPAAKPTLVLFLTVDQLRPDYLVRWHDQLTGGLRRLVDEGAFAPQGVQDHAITETAPGHASTLSGRFPYSTGIARNAEGVNNNDAALVESEGIGASPSRFRGTTLADWMVAADPRTKVLSVSRKDRGAILPIGRGKYPVFWYAPASGRFVTSTWYADTLPAWVRAFNAEDRVMTRYAGQVWMPLLDAAQYPEPDTSAAEEASNEPEFPHDVPEDSMRARNLIIGTPYMDELTLAFAWRGVRALDLGGGPATDLLAVSLSSTDAVGHRWGPDSRELHDQVLRLDRALGVFLDSLFALRGRDGVVIALTADHGVAPSPDIRSRWGDNAGATRVFRDDFNPALAAVAPLVQRLRLDGSAFAFDGMLLEVDRTKVAGKEREVLQVLRAFAKEAAQVPGVLRADVLEDLARADTIKDAIARRWLHMFRPGGEVGVAVTLKPYGYWGRGNTATHGSPHDYDARVPVLFWGAPFVRGPVRGDARVVDIAPTLAAALGVRPLERLDGHALAQVLRRPTP